MTRDKQTKRRYKRQDGMNRNHKDRLFRLIFAEKRDLLELYNAIHGTTYADESALEVYTIEDVVYMGMKNDLAFIVGNVLNLYEHQSVLCGNMPLRGLFYFSSLYKKFVKSNGFNVFRPYPVSLPMPEYLVFFNGTAEMEDEWEERLSEQFLPVGNRKEEEPLVPAVDCRARILNINYGHNQALMEKCQKLKEYALFISKVREAISCGMEVKDALESAVRVCVEEDVLRDILMKNRAEVLDVILAEYDEKLQLEDMQKYGFEMGRQEGRQSGEISTWKTVILNILSRQGDIPQLLRSTIESENDVEILKEWFEAVSDGANAQALLNRMKK